MEKRKRRVLWALGLTVGLILVGTWLLPLFLPWSPLNCWHEDLDITCGRTRYQRYVLGVRVVDRQDETALSRLYRERVGEPGESSWRRVNTFSPGVHHSPHYAHHSGLHDARQVELAFEEATFSPAATRQALTTFFGLMQADDSDARSGDYAARLLEFASSAAPGRPVHAEDLPAPPPRR